MPERAPWRDELVDAPPRRRGLINAFDRAAIGLNHAEMHAGSTVLVDVEDLRELCRAVHREILHTNNGATYMDDKNENDDGPTLGDTFGQLFGRILGELEAAGVAELGKENYEQQRRFVSRGALLGLRPRARLGVLAGELAAELSKDATVLDEIGAKMAEQIADAHEAAEAPTVRVIDGGASKPEGEGAP